MYQRRNRYPRLANKLQKVFEIGHHFFITTSLPTQRHVFIFSLIPQIPDMNLYHATEKVWTVHNLPIHKPNPREQLNDLPRYVQLKLTLPIIIGLK